jgi:acyl carrier protein
VLITISTNKKEQERFNSAGIRDLKTVSLHSTLAELGMDSMMTVEIKQSLERDFEVFLTAQEIRSLTFAHLEEIHAARQKFDITSEEQPSEGTFTGSECCNLKISSIFHHFFWILVHFT